MEPELILRINATGVHSVEIHSSSEHEERAALSLYERVKPGIRVVRALLIDRPTPTETKAAGKARR